MHIEKDRSIVGIVYDRKNDIAFVAKRVEEISHGVYRLNFSDEHIQLPKFLRYSELLVAGTMRSTNPVGFIENGFPLQGSPVWKISLAEYYHIDKIYLAFDDDFEVLLGEVGLSIQNTHYDPRPLAGHKWHYGEESSECEMKSHDECSSIENKEFIECPQCGSRISILVNNCPCCKLDLNQASAHFMYCMHCGARNVRGAEYCIHCAKNINPKFERDLNEKPTLVCHHCGNHNKISAAYCVVCGKILLSEFDDEDDSSIEEIEDALKKAIADLINKCNKCPHRYTCDVFNILKKYEL